MDSRTHVEFAAKLLTIARCDPRYTIASLFPQIDRQPHTFHRMYAHSVFKARPLTELGCQVLAGESPAVVSDPYAARRFQEESSRLCSYFGAARWQRPADDPSGDAAALLAFVSHLYLDAYNQPTQVYAPVSVYCCGQWRLWEEIGDFRLRLYTTSTIDQLRAELFSDPLWKGVSLASPVALIEAMLLRLCGLSCGMIDDAIVPTAMRAMMLEPASSGETAAACGFFEQFEAALSRLHVKHLRESEAVFAGASGVGATTHERRRSLAS